MMCAFCTRCRPADCAQRGGRGEPGGDPGVRQSLQDPPPVAGPDADAGGPGSQRGRGARLQPVRHMQVGTLRIAEVLFLSFTSVLF